MPTLRVQLKPDDYFAGTWLHQTWWPRLAGRAGGLAVLVTGADLIVFAIAPSLVPSLANLALAYAGLFVLSYALQSAWLARRTHRLFARRRGFGRPYDFSFGETGIETLVDGASTMIAWDG